MRLILALAVLAVPVGTQFAIQSAAGRDIVPKGAGTGLAVIVPGAQDRILPVGIAENVLRIKSDCAAALHGDPPFGCDQSVQVVAQPAIPAVGSAPPGPAARQPDAAVSLGGTSGFESLAAPSASAQFRASGRGGYYLHYSATDNPQLPAIARAFAGTGPGVAEISFGGGFNAGFWSTDWRRQVIAKGFQPTAVIVNIDLSATAFTTKWQSYADFKLFVDAARRDGGVKTLAPITSPNQSGGSGAAGDATSVAVIHPWSDAWWDDVRAAALYGGGIALDGPPKFYFEGLPTAVQQKAYQQFTKDVIAWGHANNLWVSVLVSPYHEKNFQAYAQRFYDSLRAADRLPSHWAVVNYNACGRASGFQDDCKPDAAAYYSTVGTEGATNTQAAVALWYARHARVRP
ncbi:hypothetical protein [Methylobacterium platani]|uniref:GH26 domain-containing protein n=2 Tax=Methylobacterium platani TaxID=427683 RepID=A0A179RX17_9HYPH|nr:hypothetical protein [Methylobacterium platani]KMO10864.1 hypothetical protein SQ03_28915 [Methylobacterium platani JCM 14648]OAS13870.1 hypothetical protein A5481_30865 [Methylobacterium platani]